MTESSPVPRVQEAEMAESSLVLGAPTAEMTGSLTVQPQSPILQ